MSVASRRGRRRQPAPLRGRCRVERARRTPTGATPASCWSCNKGLCGVCNALTGVQSLQLHALAEAAAAGEAAPPRAANRSAGCALPGAGYQPKNMLPSPLLTVSRHGHEAVGGHDGGRHEVSERRGWVRRRDGGEDASQAGRVTWALPAKHTRHPLLLPPPPPPPPLSCPQAHDHAPAERPSRRSGPRAVVLPHNGTLILTLRTSIYCLPPIISTPTSAHACR